MLHVFLDDEKWFKPKRYGYGVGWPTNWKGWALILAYCIAVIGISESLISPGPQDFVLRLSLVIGLTVILLLIARRKTERGWRWRWGE